MENKKVYSIEALLLDTDCLVSLSEVCLKLREKLSDPDHKKIEIVNLIKCDPALVVRLLKLVNSSYYSLVSPVTDIFIAIGLLGEKELNHIVVSAYMVETLNILAEQVTSLDIKQFWMSSIFSAVLSRNLAIDYSEDIRNDLFITGLLLNIGKLPIYQHSPGLLDIVTHSDLQDFEVEKAELGFDHAEVGAFMIKEWVLSESISENIFKHHCQPTPEESSKAQVIAYISSYCGKRLDFFHNTDGIPVVISNDIFEYLDQLEINMDTMNLILEESFVDFVEIFELFFGKKNKVN